jgi:hypothetical protein
LTACLVRRSASGHRRHLCHADGDVPPLLPAPRGWGSGPGAPRASARPVVTPRTPYPANRCEKSLLA